MSFNKNQSPAELMRLRKMRWLGRTDLHYLAKFILGYPDIDPIIHGPLINIVQKFPLPPANVIQEVDIVQPGFLKYTPFYKREELVGGRRTLLLDPRSGLKCQPETAELSCANGTYTTVKNIKVGDTLRGIDDGTFNLNTSVVTGKEFQGLQDCYKVTLRSRREIITSYNHPYRKLSGWVDAQDLAIGDRVAILGHVPEPSEALNLPYAEMLGWFLGDGSFSNQVVTNENPLFQHQIMVAANNCGGTAHVTQPEFRTANVRIQGLRGIWQELGLLDKTSGDKFIPEVVFRSSNKSVKELLYGLYMSDGTATVKGIFLTTKSPQMAKDVQRLLLRFNIFAHIRDTVHRTGPYAGNVYKTVAVSSTTQVEKFIAAIGWEKANKFLSAQKMIRSNINTVPKEWRKMYGKYLFARGERKTKDLPTNKSHVKYDISKEKLKVYAEALDNNLLRQLATDDIYWDFVEKVEYLGKLPTWGIETSTGNYGIDDVVTHNTTLNAIAHSIQHLLNFPQFAVLIVQSNTEKVHEIIKEIKYHFQYNEKFRAVYPDYCPQRRINDWGNRDGFTIPNRREVCQRLNIVEHKEDSVTGSSIDKGSAGRHYEVLKFSDIVEPATVRTKDQIENTIYQFGMAENLLVKPRDWIDVEGTRYDFGDLYGKIIDNWMKEHENGTPHKWNIHVRGCYIKDVDNPKYTPDELRIPFRRTEDGKPISWWPDVWPVERLEEDRTDPVKSEYLFATQRLNDPVATSSDNKPFPCNDHYPKWISRENFQKVPIAYHTITIDTADTANENSNYTVLTVGAWDAGGRCNVCEIDMGKYLPDKIIEQLFLLNKKYKPLNILMEETGFVRGFKAAILRRSNLTGVYLPLSFIRRENNITKQERILNTLQPWYKSGTLRFLDDLAPKHELLQQLSRFPKYDDDILDTLADLFQNKEYFGRETPRPETPDQFDTLYEQTQADAVRHWSTNQPRYMKRFLGAEDIPDLNLPPDLDPMFQKTGGL